MPGSLVFIGLGSNLGDRRATIREAVRRIGKLDGVRLLKVSRLRETHPVGNTRQPMFLNGCAKVRTILEPRELLRRLQEIETDLGRVRNVRWGARTIDLDVLLWGYRTIRRSDLKVPHPRLAERRFVLEPLADLAPARRVPGTRRSVRRLLNELERTGP